MAKSCTVVWFRRDLRLEDNPALAAAARAGAVVPVFIWSPDEEGQFRPGRVSRWWLKQSLIQLDISLRSLGVSLVMINANDTVSALLELVKTTGASQVVYNHLYDPVSLVRDHRVKQSLVQNGIQVQSFNGDLLYEPWEVLDDHGKPFTYFESYWAKCLTMPFEPESPLLPPRRLTAAPAGIVHSLTPDELGLEDEADKSSNALLARAWAPGWSNADKALEAFLAGPFLNYSRNRHEIDGPTTSLLSPHLHFGEVSVRKVFHSVRRLQVLWAKDGSMLGEESINYFMRSIGFREYSRYLCFNFPFTHERSLLSNLKSFPWRVDEGLFKAWRQGRTGYPLVDAGMRELWATGWLHNRVRVIVSSFCVKFLQLPWRWGMKYFWDTLLDADLESDILGWQYISGSLPDGHELDRMDNPQTEGYKHDPLGEYVRRWLPELVRLPTEWIHHPWDAPPGVLRAAGVELGSNYPRPVVEVAAARERLRDAVTHMWEQEAALKAAGDKGIEEASVGDSIAKVNCQPEVAAQPCKIPKASVSQATNGDMEVSSAGSSRRDQMVPTFAKELKTQADALCGDYGSIALPLPSQQNLPCPSTNFSAIRGVSKLSPGNRGDMVDTTEALRNTHSEPLPPVSDTNPMTESSSSSSPREQISSIKDDPPMIWVPAIAHQRPSSDFGCVPYAGDAEQLRKHLLILQNARTDDKVEDGVQLNGSQWARGSKRKAKS
uniref:Blue-light photoreceptor n=1 Tax=Adiantum capillus-veneris TaxID=13818 RepID=O82779_ADICA|nr:blue-light photoreceptor [Adiantum capillus-veneris]BAA32812.1 blue-light photoreceptor [Adiantum capillus-veneris]